VLDPQVAQNAPVPWCETCSRFWNPPSLTPEGACPTCGRSLAAAPVRTPWHFKLLLAALGVYLGWRGWQGVVWLVHRW
jgi:hypothetical protein